MKIGILTIHYANSYGGCLQAFASQVVLSKYGDAVIIDYKTPALKSTMSKLRFSRNPRSFLHVIKDILRLFPRIRLLRKFHDFMGSNYRLSRSCVSTADLKSLSSEYDIFVCGSDQIWNPFVTGKLNSPYLLGFARGNRKVAFSTSAGSYRFSRSEQEKIKNLIDEFSSLSFREADMVQQIAEITGRKDIQHTLDPTLLLTKSEWIDLLALEKDDRLGKYVFVYTLKKDKAVYEVVRWLAKRLDLKVVAVDQDPFLLYRTDIHIRDAGPVEFLNLMLNAEFVITNSFHGTAFAVNFGLQFLAVKPETGTNRIKGFLESVGLGSRFVNDVNDVELSFGEEIDFAMVKERLNVLRNNTYAYLADAFGSYE